MGRSVGTTEKMGCLPALPVSASWGKQLRELGAWQQALTILVIDLPDAGNCTVHSEANRVAPNYSGIIEMNHVCDE